VHLLLLGGANPNDQDLKGWTSLHLASFLEKTVIVGPLLKGGANANAQDKARTRRTALHLASFFGKTEIVHLLHLASPRWREVVHLLLESGANPNARDKEGWLSVHLASSMKKTEVVRLLLEGGANANARFKDLKGWT
jgi:ankyrin repeat protein